MSPEFKLPKGFTQYLSRQRNAISRIKTPTVEVRQGFLILNPAVVKASGARPYVVLMYNEAEKEVGLWFWKTPVHGSSHVLGRSKRDIRYVSFRGFRHRFLDGEGASMNGPITRPLVQDKENRDFFKFQLEGKGSG